MRGHDGFSFNTPIVANSAQFQLNGGAYVLDVVANFNGGSVTLQRLGPDGATFITAATAVTANGTSGAIALPPGTYQLLVASATALYASVTPIPSE